jgi:hypothetical protein
VAQKLAAEQAVAQRAAAQKLAAEQAVAQRAAAQKLAGQRSAAEGPAAALKVTAGQSAERPVVQQGAQPLAAQKAAQQAASLEAVQQAYQEVAQEAAQAAKKAAQQAAKGAAWSRSDAEVRLRRTAAAVREAGETARAEQRAAAERLSQQPAGLTGESGGARAAGDAPAIGNPHRAIDEPWLDTDAVPNHLEQLLRQLDEQLKEI